MGAHIFLVGQHNFETCILRGVYGCVMPNSERNRAEVVAGVLSIQPDDLAACPRNTVSVLMRV